MILLLGQYCYNELVSFLSVYYLPGIYPKGVTNHDYVDYIYVGGSQNPTSEIITEGKVQLNMVSVPAGSYDVRYLWVILNPESCVSLNIELF